MKKNKKVLVTGAAGFIGYHLVKKLCETDYQIIGIDNLNDYYSPKLKKIRLSILSKNKNFIFYKVCQLKTTSINRF